MTGRTVRIIHSGRALEEWKAESNLMRLATFLADLFALGFRHGDGEMLHLFGQIHIGEGFADGFGAHLGDEGIGAVGFAGFAVFVLAQSWCSLRGVEPGSMTM